MYRFKQIRKPTFHMRARTITITKTIAMTILITIMVMINIMKMKMVMLMITMTKTIMTLIIRNGPSYDYQISSFYYNRKNEPFVVVAGIS